MGGVIGACSLWPERLSGPGAKARGAHEAGDAISRTGDAEAVKFAAHPGAAIAAGVAVVMDGSHVGDELGIGFCTRPQESCGGGVVAAAGDAERVAKFTDGEGVPHGVNQRIPLCGSSESMLMAFFKISRWRRR
jgi:hypothetical protein